MERLQEILEQGQREKNEKRKPKHMARKILAWAKKMRGRRGNLLRWKGIYKKY